MSRNQTIYKTYGSLSESKTNQPSQPSPPQENEKMSLIEIETPEQRNEMIKNVTLLVIDYYASWCRPCKEMLPDLEKIANEYRGIVVFAKHTVEDENLGIPRDVTGVPTFHFFSNQQFRDDLTIVGANTQLLRENIQKLIASNSS